MAKMSWLSLSKSIEATKLHPRTGRPLGLPEVTIPYSALIEYAGPDQDCEKFTYLGEMYSCKRDLFESATGGSKGAPEAAPEQESDAGTPAHPPRLAWMPVQSTDYAVARCAVPGGWLVALNGASLTFVPDPAHQWDGGPK